MKKYELISELSKLIHSSEKLMEEIRKIDPNFDAGYKIDAGIARASEALENCETLDFDFRQLQFRRYGYKLVDDVKSSNKDAWFEKADNEDDSIHVYVPEFVRIDPLSADDEKYIVVVEILKGCEHYKTLVIQANVWMKDKDSYYIDLPPEECKEKEYQDMADYIMTWAFKDREVEAYK